MQEFSFVLNKNSLALTERKWFFRVYTAFVVKLWVSKEVKPVKFCPLSLLSVVRLFRFCYFRRFRHFERGIKSLSLEVTFIKVRSCIDLHWFLFCWRIWPFLLLLGGTCRTWTILWTGHERLLTESGHGMATPEKMEVDNDQRYPTSIFGKYLFGRRFKI